MSANISGTPCVNESVRMSLHVYIHDICKKTPQLIFVHIGSIPLTSFQCMVLMYLYCQIIVLNLYRIILLDVINAPHLCKLGTHNRIYIPIGTIGQLVITLSISIIVIRKITPQRKYHYHTTSR